MVLRVMFRDRDRYLHHIHGRELMAQAEYHYAWEVEVAEVER
jgi:hypothetical protein